jgi:hypothetical protein
MTAIPSVISNYWGDLLLQQLHLSGGYLALHETDPTVTGDITTELAGSTRQLVTFNAPSGRAIVSNNNQIFSLLPEAVIPFLAIWDALASGHMLCSISLAALGYSPISILADGQFLAAAGDVAVQL